MVIPDAAAPTNDADDGIVRPKTAIIRQLDDGCYEPRADDDDAVRAKTSTIQQPDDDGEPRANELRRR